MPPRPTRSGAGDGAKAKARACLIALSLSAVAASGGFPAHTARPPPLPHSLKGSLGIEREKERERRREGDGKDPPIKGEIAADQTFKDARRAAREADDGGGMHLRL